MSLIEQMNIHTVEKSSERSELGIVDWKLWKIRQIPCGQKCLVSVKILKLVKVSKVFQNYQNSPLSVKIAKNIPKLTSKKIVKKFG